MPATVRYAEQYCPIARALDTLGDRWTLLILRELVGGDKRFTDLRDHLPGIAPTLLTQRLRTMIDHGLVATKELPPPAARSVYTTTERGRSAIPVLRALARWGVPLLEAPESDSEIRPWMAANAMVAAFYRPEQAVGIDERYLLDIDGEQITLSSVKGAGEPHATPDLVLQSDARSWVDIRQGRVTLRQAIKQGRIRRTGNAAALSNFQRIFALT
ncbi:MAG: winged helix-turn-helix transcriptional regulator [Ilumatobacteraceae bacterium]